MKAKLIAMVGSDEGLNDPKQETSMTDGRKQWLLATDWAIRAQREGGPVEEIRPGAWATEFDNWHRHEPGPDAVLAQALREGVANRYRLYGADVERAVVQVMDAMSGS